MDFDPNSNLNYLIAANWHWDFEQIIPQIALVDMTEDEAAAATQAYIDLYDAADTYLGNVAAGIADDMNGKVTTNIQFSFEAAATQID